MTFQIRAPGKLLTAIFTYMFLLMRMGQHMFSHLRLLSESLTTDGAAIRLLSSMDSIMDTHIFLRIEPLLADIAEKLEVVSMDTQVGSHVVSG
jgi:hypothetical protein